MADVGDLNPEGQAVLREGVRLEAMGRSVPSRWTWVFRMTSVDGVQMVEEK